MYFSRSAYLHASDLSKDLKNLGQTILNKRVRNLLVSHEELGLETIKTLAQHSFQFQVEVTSLENYIAFRKEQRFSNTPALIIISIDWHNSDIMAAVKLALNNTVDEIIFSLEDHRQKLTKEMNSAFNDLGENRVFFDFAQGTKTNTRGFTANDVINFLKNARTLNSNIRIRPHYSRNSAIKLADVSTSYVAWSNRPELATPKFSFIIPCYNNATFLAETLSHLASLNAEKSLYETIVVDDGSEQNMANEIQDFVSHLPAMNITYCYWPKPNPDAFRAGEARNIGATLACASNFIFLDSDIIVTPNFLKFVEESLNAADVVQFVRRHIRPHRSDIGVKVDQLDRQDIYTEEANYWNKLFDCQDWMSLNDYWKYTCTYCLAVRAQCFWAAGGITPNYPGYGFEDTDLGYKFHLQGLRFKLCKEPTYHLTNELHPKHIFQRHGKLRRASKRFFFNFYDLEIYEIFRALLSEFQISFYRWHQKIQETAAPFKTYADKKINKHIDENNSQFF